MLLRDTSEECSSEVFLRITSEKHFLCGERKKVPESLVFVMSWECWIGMAPEGNQKGSRGARESSRDSRWAHVGRSQNSCWLPGTFLISFRAPFQFNTLRTLQNKSFWHFSHFSAQEMFLRSNSEKYFWETFLRSISQKYSLETFLGIKIVPGKHFETHVGYTAPPFPRRKVKREWFLLCPDRVTTSSAPGQTSSAPVTTSFARVHRSNSEVILRNTSEKHSSAVSLRSIP